MQEFSYTIIKKWVKLNPMYPRCNINISEINDLKIEFPTLMLLKWSCCYDAKKEQDQRGGKRRSSGGGGCWCCAWAWSHFISPDAGTWSFSNWAWSWRYTRWWRHSWINIMLMLQGQTKTSLLQIPNHTSKLIANLCQYNNHTTQFTNLIFVNHMCFNNEITI